MESTVCRLCYSKNSKLKFSINDDMLVKFLDFVSPKVVLDDDHSLSISVCQLCFGKAKLCLDFITKIQESQKNFKTKDTKCPNLSETFDNDVVPKPTIRPEDALKRIQHNLGISVKKVSLVKRSNPFTPVKPITRTSISRPQIIQEEVIAINSEGSNDDDDDFAPEQDSEEDSEEEYRPSLSKKKAAPWPTTSSASNPPNEPVLKHSMKFTCGWCKIQFSSLEELAEHMKGKNCSIDLKKCKICSKEFDTYAMLQKHSQTHRSKPKVKLNEKSICEACGKELRSASALENHLALVHNLEPRVGRPFSCSECSSTFQTQQALVSHVKMHVRKKEDTGGLCEICAKICPDRKSYMTHLRKHNRKRSYICEICTKGFYEKIMLVQHMHVHTGIKSFHCDLCDKSYAKRDSLRKHKKRDHRNEENEGKIEAEVDVG